MKRVVKTVVGTLLLLPILLVVGYLVRHGVEYHYIKHRFENLADVRILEFRDNNEESIGRVEVFARIVVSDEIEMEFWDVTRAQLDDTSAMILWSINDKHPRCRQIEGEDTDLGVRMSSAPGTVFASLQFRRLEDVAARADQLWDVLRTWPRSIEEAQEVQLEGEVRRCWLQTYE